MTVNEIRDTPGRLLLGWAVLLTTLVILAWRVHLNATDYDWVEYPTALGDTHYYTALGKDDRYETNLRFTSQDKGLYRRSLEPVALDDATMLKVAEEATKHCFVYEKASDTETKSGLFYLKSGENQYVEFGPRKHYPPYVPAVPAGQ